MEKYLKVWLPLGDKGRIEVALFKNKDKTEPKHPDYKGKNGACAWVNEFDPGKDDKVEEEKVKDHSKEI